jgi:prepilin-type N-terminal cleavage/methylation domain-containing protein/prepilin-type processing-associated H-X9-DG protein
MMHFGKTVFLAPKGVPTPPRFAAFRADIKAFTLIELLVVIAIIAILAAILFPVFAQAREKARQTTCLSNVKQTGLGVMMYVQDFDEGYPCNWFGSGSAEPWRYRDPVNGNPNNRYRWMDAVQPYIKNAQLFGCPSAPGNNRYTYRTRDQLTGVADSSSLNSFEGAYCTNVFYWDGGPGTPPSSDGTNYVTTLAKVGRPAETIWMMEGDGAYQCAVPNIGWHNYVTRNLARGVLGRSAFAVTGAANVENLEGAVVARHQNRVNVMWCDGHAKSITLNEMTTLGTPLVGTDPATRAWRLFTVEED